MKWKYILFSIVTTVVFFWIVEGCSYLLYRTLYGKDFMPFDATKALYSVDNLFEERTLEGQGKVWFSPNFPTRYYMDDKNYFGKYISYDKKTPSLRIFSYGGSTTAGSPWGYAASFTRFVHDELNKISQPGTIEVMNFGYSGLGSSRVYTIVEESIKYQPDVLLIFSGHNEPGEHDMYLKITQSPLAKLYQLGIFDKLYIFKFGKRALNALRSKIMKRLFYMFNSKDKQFSDKVLYNEKERKMLVAQYERNIRRIIMLAKRYDIDVVLVSQPVDYFYPTYYKPPNRVMKNYIDELEGMVEAGSYEKAKGRIRLILERDPQASIAYYYKGLITVYEGDAAGALENFRTALEYNQRPHRAPDSYRIMLKALAQEHANCYFVDAKEKFSDYLGDEIIDGRLMMDKMHPTVEGQKIIAKSILEDYFLKYRVGGGFINYDLYDYNGVWKNNIDPNFYFKMCKRYYPTDDVSLCIKIALSELEKPSLEEMRKARNVWELIYYKGLMEIQNGNIDEGVKLFMESKEVYNGRSLMMCIDKYSKGSAYNRPLPKFKRYCGI